MTERLREQLSALADDELDHGEMALLLRQYGGNDELRGCWHAYHVIGEIIRRGFPAADAGCIADRVKAALDTDTAVESAAPQQGASRRWMKVLRPVGAAAVAASVSLVAVMLVRAPTSTGSGAAPAEVVPPQARAPRANFDYAAVSSVRWDQGSPAVRRELNEYLLDHNEDAPTLGRQDMLPYLHLATFYASAPAANHGSSTRAPRAGEGHRE